jgi:hypothetical protein
VEEGAVEVDDEVDAVAWLSRRDALSILDHRSDRLLLRDRRQVLLVDGSDDDPRFAGVLEIVARAARTTARTAAMRLRTRSRTGGALLPSDPG